MPWVQLLQRVPDQQSRQTPAQRAQRSIDASCYVISGLVGLIGFFVSTSRWWVLPLSLAFLGYGLRIWRTRKSYWTSFFTYIIPLAFIFAAVVGIYHSVRGGSDDSSQGIGAVVGDACLTNKEVGGAYLELKPSVLIQGVTGTPDCLDGWAVAFPILGENAVTAVFRREDGGWRLQDRNSVCEQHELPAGLVEVGCDSN